MCLAEAHESKQLIKDKKTQITSQPDNLGNQILKSVILFF
jgi:hypothetical protein